MSKNDTALRDILGMHSSSRWLVTRALLSAFVLQGCLVTEADPNYCANVNGNFFCKHRHGSDGPHYCLDASNACLTYIPGSSKSDPSFDGCLDTMPDDESCYSPCGNRQSFLENSSCIEETTEMAGDTSTTDSGGTATGTTSDVGVDGTTFTTEGTSGTSMASSETAELATTSGSTGDTGSTSDATTGSTGDVCDEMWGSTNWGGCLNELGAVDVELMCGAGAACVILSIEPVSHTACSVDGCDDVCDCPAPPATGTAMVTCGDIDGDSEDECHLDCSVGSCPVDMDCVSNETGAMYCATPTEPAPMYGACDAGCALPGECFITTNTSHEICIVPCFDIDSCAPAPGISVADAECGSPFFGGLEDVCYLSCDEDVDCPQGMDCLFGNEETDGVLMNFDICVWPI